MKNSKPTYITSFYFLIYHSRWPEINKSAQTGCPFRRRRQQFSTSGHICEQGRVPISIGLNSCVNKTLFWARDERHAPMVATAELFVELGLLKAEDDCRRKRLTRLIDLKNVYSWLKTEVTKVFTFYILTWNYRRRLWFGKKTQVFKKTCFAMIFFYDLISAILPSNHEKISADLPESEKRQTNRSLWLWRPYDPAVRPLQVLG